MTHLLEKHVAVVTGAGSGIGRAIALGFADEGAIVAVLDIDLAAAEETVSQIDRAGGKAKAFLLDVADRQECRTVAADVARALGPVSVVVNNAGIARRNGFVDDPELVAQDWQDILEINLSGVFNVSRAFLDQLRTSRGRVVNIASVQSLIHLRSKTSPAYTTAKHGILGLTKALAAELGQYGVRVNAVGPGFVETALTAGALEKNPALVQANIDRTPLGRVARPEDVVGPVVFLASDMAAFVTGAMLMVDGGFTTV